MDYFNKNEFEQLKNLPRSAHKKRATMERIQNSRGSKQPHQYPLKYIFVSFAVILLTVLFISTDIFSPMKQANEVSELNSLLAEKDEEIKRLEERYSMKVTELHNAIKSLEMVRWSSIARLDNYEHSFYNLENIYKIHSNYEIEDDWYVIHEDYFQIELLHFENARKVDFYSLRQESGEGKNLIFTDTNSTDGWLYTNDNIDEIINKHEYNKNGFTYEPYFVIYAEVTLADGSVIQTSKLPIYYK